MKNFRKIESDEKYTFVMYGNDWFVGITCDGKIGKNENSYDYRSKEEIKIALQKIM